MRPSDTQRRLGVAEDGDADGSWSAPESRRESEKPILGSNYTRAGGLSRSRCTGGVRHGSSVEDFADLSGQRSQKERLLQKVAGEVWNTLSLLTVSFEEPEANKTLMSCRSGGRFATS